MTLENITVGVDGSDCSIAALRWADRLAETSGAALKVVMAWHYPYLTTMPGIMAAVPPSDEMEEATKDVLVELIGPVDEGRQIEPVAWQGGASGVLIEASKDADLLVVGSRGHGGLARLGLGSTSHQTTTHAECSVAIIRSGTEPLPDAPSLTVAVDGSDHSIDALAWAMTALPGEGRIIGVLSHDERVLDDAGVDPDTADRLHREATAHLDAAITAATERVTEAGRSASPIDPLVLRGDPRTTVIAAARDTDLLVVGARGRGGIAGMLLGSFATYVLTHGPEEIPIVIAR